MITQANRVRAKDPSKSLVVDLDAETLASATTSNPTIVFQQHILGQWQQALLPYMIRRTPQSLRNDGIPISADLPQNFSTRVIVPITDEEKEAASVADETTLADVDTSSAGSTVSSILV